MAHVMAHGISETGVGEAMASLPAERALLETVRRVLRRPAGWRALALHLSRLPERRPYHGRIGRALLEEAAPRFDGQIHALSNGDLLFFCREEGGALRGLVALMERLFPETLISLWPLESEALHLVAYTAGRLTESGGAAPSPPARPEAAERLLTNPALSELPDPAALVQRENGIRLAQGRMELAFRDWRIAPDRLSAAQDSGDPALLRHHLGALDHDLLVALRESAGTGLPLDPVPHRAVHPAWPAPPPPLHLHLSLAGVLSKEFPPLAALCRESDVPLAVVLAFEEACADARALEAGRAVIAANEARLVLDGVRCETFSCAAPAALAPDGLVIDVGPALAGLAAHECRRLFHPLGGDQVILRGADDEAALAFGLAAGIILFQGRHVAAMAAAARMFACPSARNCTLGQCMTRAKAAEPEGRFGCAEPALLDGMVPREGGKGG